MKKIFYNGTAYVEHVEYSTYLPVPTRADLGRRRGPLLCATIDIRASNIYGATRKIIVATVQLRFHLKTWAIKSEKKRANLF